MAFELITGAEYSRMCDQHAAESVWPEFILHDPVGERYWESLYTDFPEYQFTLKDGDAVVGSGNSIPLNLDSIPDDRGWDWALEKGYADRKAGRIPNVLCGLQIGIGPDYRGKGTSERMIGIMRWLASERGFKEVILPIRPTLKHKYPLIPMAEYILWRTPEGLPFDPWIRAHARLGAEILAVCSRAMTIPGSIEEWEAWTGLAIRSSGEYVFNGGLTPLKADLGTGRAEYVEPNVWMVHRV